MIHSLLHVVKLPQTWLIKTETASRSEKTFCIDREPGCTEATTQDYRAMWTEFTLERASGKSQSQQIIVLAI